jgi:RHS repeat-associated protein
LAPAFFPPHLDHRASGTSTSYSYDPVSRLSQLVQNPAGTTHDLTLGFSYNPASQIISNTRSNDTYAWTGHGSGTLSSPTNGLNQLTSHNGGSISHDAKGNITCDPTVANSYGYSSENLLTNVSGSTWSNVLSYDPGMRLYQTGSVRNGYDGDERIAEYNSSGTQTARYIHGPGIDEPLIGYSGSGLATRSFLHADERGTIIARSDDAGNVVSVGKFDEYGKHQSLASRFAFAGMPMETLTYLHYARARMYNQRLPRFMQPDVIRYGDGPNMYIRTKGDPVNFTDPTGLCGDPTGDTCEPIDVVGERLPTIGNGALLRSGRGGTGSGGGGGGGARGRVSGGNQTPKYQISRRLTKKNTKCSLSQVSQAVNQTAFRAAQELTSLERLTRYPRFLASPPVTFSSERPPTAGHSSTRR